MTLITFPYREEQSKILGRIYRPVARVKLKSENEWYPSWMYIDSGADITLIPRSVGDLLGFEVERERIVDISGVGGGNVPVIIKEIMIDIGGGIFDARVAWALIEDVPPLLGRMDVFLIFEAIFKEWEKVVVFNKRGVKKEAIGR
uniref:Peptidase A2 domain-containing protein n=1 Tax=Candidatus Methanophagaceae archaeon ANME-1 ERB6 TaxID=2759912 RepID=A0A7G9YWG5_9EURY|nr:hypothetical protein CJELADDK_00028 [Methanosarcinales archaeon ANME-1 ERB6]